MRKASYVLFLVTIILNIVSVVYLGFTYLIYMPQLQDMAKTTLDPELEPIISFLMNSFPWICLYGVISSVVAVIYSIVARVKLSGYVEESDLRTIGIVGLVLGIIAGGIPLILAGIFAICAANNHQGDHFNNSNNSNHDSYVNYYKD